MIGVINYKAGNAPSVLNALKKIDIPCNSVSSSQEIENLTGLILPGVGSAKATMDSLSEMGLIEVMEKKILCERIPFLGICIGIQILFKHSEEENTDCLGWIAGNVKRFSDEKVRVPHIGWNQVLFLQEHPVILGLRNSEYLYFVNSFYPVPRDEKIALGKTEYDVDFCSMLAHDNIIATQFHVEKSGIVGLKILQNFASIASN